MTRRAAGPSLRPAARIVSRVSSGNIRLQRGEYVTRADLEEQYERVSEDS